MIYEYKTASFMIRGIRNGHPVEEVDDRINLEAKEGWEFVQLASGATTASVSVIIVFRRPAATS
jgi:hypothetical protein